MEKITKVGFFHFGSGHGAPMKALRCALREKAAKDLHGALIVLPEGFGSAREFGEMGNWRRLQRFVLPWISALGLEPRGPTL